MIRKLVSFILISSMLVILPDSTSSSQYILCDGSSDNVLAHVDNSSAYLSVPFHYQMNNYYCGPAALEMVLDYYGEDIPQTEIADVARTYPYVTFMDELRRAAHFSSLSTSLGDEMPGDITGYSARKVGYAAFEQWGLTIDDLKAWINKGDPLIALMWWTPSKVYGHYRLVVGYNETHIIMHDPWNKNLWGGTYGGANTSMTYPTFLDLWEYLDNWGLSVRPWNVDLQMPSTVAKEDHFEVTANITYPCSAPFDIADYPASSCKATIVLPEGLELASGETAQHSLGSITAGTTLQISWTIHADETGFYNITVTATGRVEGSVGAHGTCPSYDYEDEIGGSCINSLSIVNQTHRVHNLDTGLNYTTIQKAINAPETLDDHTIIIESGTYCENLVVNKSLSLIGEIRETTIIDGNWKTALNVTARGVHIGNVTVRNSFYGILIESDNCYISKDDITGNYHGIFLWGSSSNTLFGNRIFNNYYHGIQLYDSSQNNTVIGNNITKNWAGVVATSSSHAFLAANDLTDNQYGVFLGNSSSNHIYHNNFINNTYQATAYSEPRLPLHPPVIEPSNSSVWDDGYPSGGNYWSDYNGTDSNQDGIGDLPYAINGNNTDNHPLRGTFSDFNATSEHSVQTICNSTISDFQFNGTAISFKVTGEDGSTGFCRICIPTALMNDTFRMFVNGTEILPSPEPLPCSNSTHNYLYFAYSHSTQEVVIIPEFPSFLILPLFMISALLAAIFYRRKHSM